jgi:tetratricopeptide (TPR) repeat protein
MQQTRDIKTLDIHALEETMERYPWFAAARAEYFSRMVAMDREYIRPAARKIGLFVPDRCRLYDIVVLGHTPKEKPGRRRAILRADVRPEEDHRDDAPLEQPAREIPEPQPAETPRRRVPGGDYFSKQDFEELAESGQGFADLRFTPKSNLSSSLDRAAGILASEARPKTPDTDEVCTETLAGIYYSQGFYRRAIDIYKKLILFYPEKNTYFAALIERCKEKTKQ